MIPKTLSCITDSTQTSSSTSTLSFTRTSSATNTLSTSQIPSFTGILSFTDTTTVSSITETPHFTDTLSITWSESSSTYSVMFYNEGFGAGDIGADRGFEPGCSGNNGWVIIANLDW